MKKNYSIALILLLIWGFCSPVAWAQTEDYRLTVNTPDYWGGSHIIDHLDRGQGNTITNRIPADQSKDQHDESIWELRLKTSRPIPITKLANDVLTSYWSQCETLRTTEPSQVIERGYDVLYVQANCNRIKASPGKGYLFRAKFLCKLENCFAVLHQFSLNSFEATRGGNVSTIPGQAFGGEDKIKRFQRYAERSTYFLQNGVYLCPKAEAACS